VFAGSLQATCPIARPSKSTNKCIATGCSFPSPSKQINEEMHGHGFPRISEKQAIALTTDYSKSHSSKPTTTKTVAACAVFHWARGQNRSKKGPEGPDSKQVEINLAKA
jgi:hypothetical protein